jgi:hypothetical protein
MVVWLRRLHLTATLKGLTSSRGCESWCYEHVQAIIVSIDLWSSWMARYRSTVRTGSSREEMR